MSRIKKCAIYGGTFNPPHIGHVRAAEAFFNAVKPDELLIIPTFLPPHKDQSFECAPEHRVNMCTLAFSHIDGARVSDIEIKRGGKSYTYMTLQELSGEDRELYFLCGTDMLLTLDMWKHPEIIFDLAKICYVRRESDRTLDGIIEEKITIYKEKYKAEIVPIGSEVFEISSTEIRDTIRSGGDLSKILPSNVIGYISKEGLYQ